MGYLSNKLIGRVQLLSFYWYKFNIRWKGTLNGNWRVCLTRPLDDPSSRETGTRQAGNRAVFNWVSKVISELLWFMITSLSDWFKVLVPLFQPIRSDTKTLRVTLQQCYVKRLAANHLWQIDLYVTANAEEFYTRRVLFVPNSTR